MGNIFYFPWEETVMFLFQDVRNEVLDWIAPKVSFLGNSGWFFMVLTLMALIFIKSDKRIGVNMFLSLLISALLVNVILKPLVNRARPCDIWDTVDLIVNRPYDSSFPSGHTNASFATAVAVLTRNKKWGIPLVVLATLIALSRIYLFMHFPTDVLVGAIIGTCCGIATFYLTNWIYKKTGKSIDTLKLF